MKIRTDKFKNTSDFQGRQGSATLNMDKLSLFMDSMISNYNYPELAVLREWVSNAHDAHVAAGIKAPVKVTLPSQLNPTLTVQDFGLGMTSDFVENFYLSFGSSSKDDSNDEIGGFGQGGKSALAIASQYTMTTISEGLKNIYIFERSPLGGVDFKLVVEEVPTDEPSGTVVQVAVDRWDQYSEVNLNRVLTGWSNSDIELNTGKKFFSIPDNSTEVSYAIDLTDETKENYKEDIRQEKGFVLHGAVDKNGVGGKLSRELSLGHDQHVVLVGPVAYIFAPESYSAPVVRDYMVASVNIGDVSFPSSREVIEPTKSNRKVVAACFEQIAREAEALLQKKADAIQDRNEALALYRSPLASAFRSNITINFKGEEVPTEFTPKADDEIFSYEQIGNWQGVRNYKLVAEEFPTPRKLALNIQTLVVMDDDSSSQAIRNNARVRHASLGHSPKDLSGFLVISKKADKWLSAAAEVTLKSSELAAIAKEHRREEREAKAAAQAAGTAPVVPVKKTRKDRIGEYNAHWMDFANDAEGNLIVSEKRGDLMDFFTSIYDPRKTLVLSTNESDYAPGDFVGHFKSYSINPSDAQFLKVYTGSKIETLRILLGEEVKIQNMATWMSENFLKLAKFKGRKPAEIAAELPVEIDSMAANLFKNLGVDTIHPKYKEFLKLQEELDEAKELTSGRGYYYTPAARMVHNLLNSFEDVKVPDRPEFFFLKNLGYHRAAQLEEAAADAVRFALNQMVENWLDNLALEEAEAEDAAEDAAKAEATQPVLAATKAN